MECFFDIFFLHQAGYGKYEKAVYAALAGDIKSVSGIGIEVFILL